MASAHAAYQQRLGRRSYAINSTLGVCNRQHGDHSSSYIPTRVAMGKGTGVFIPLTAASVRQRRSRPTSDGNKLQLCDQAGRTSDKVQANSDLEPGRLVQDNSTCGSHTSTMTAHSAAKTRMPCRSATFTVKDQEQNNGQCTRAASVSSVDRDLCSVLAYANRSGDAHQRQTSHRSDPWSTADGITGPSQYQCLLPPEACISSWDDLEVVSGSIAGTRTGSTLSYNSMSSPSASVVVPPSPDGTGTFPTLSSDVVLLPQLPQAVETVPAAVDKLVPVGGHVPMSFPRFIPASPQLNTAAHHASMPMIASWPHQRVSDAATAPLAAAASCGSSLTDAAATLLQLRHQLAAARAAAVATLSSSASATFNCCQTTCAMGSSSSSQANVSSIPGSENNHTVWAPFPSKATALQDFAIRLPSLHVVPAASFTEGAPVLPAATHAAGVWPQLPPGHLNSSANTRQAWADTQERDIAAVAAAVATDKLKQMEALQALHQQLQQDVATLLPLL